MKYLLLLLFIILFIESFLGIKLGLGTGFSIKNLLLYISLLAIIFKYVIAKPIIIKKTKFLLSIFLFLLLYSTINFLYVYISGVYTNYGNAFFSLKAWLGDQFIFFIIFLLAFNNKDDTIWLIKYLLFILMISNIVTFLDALNLINIPSLEQIQAGSSQEGRVQGYLHEHNQFAAFQVFIFPLFLYQLINNNIINKIIYGIGLFATACLLILGGSRGALVGLFLGTIIFYAYFFRSIAHEKVAYIFVTILIFLGLSLPLAMSKHESLIYSRYIDSVQKDDISEVSSGRIDTWKFALSSLSENPFTFFTGYGWDSSLYKLNIQSLHNTYLEYLFQLGLIGLGLLMLIFYKIIAMLKNIKNNCNLNSFETYHLLLFCYGLINLLGAIFFVDLYSPWQYIWMLIGLHVSYFNLIATDLHSEFQVMTRPEPTQKDIS